MALKPLAFQEWVPDQPDIGNEFVEIAKNVLPTARGSLPMKELSQYAASSTDSTPLAAIAVIASDRSVNFFCGDAGKLYKYNSGTSDWDDVSKSGGYTTTAAWNFAQYGDLIVATNYVDDPQYFDLTTSTLFADLTTETKFRYVTVIGDFIVGANTFDSVDQETSYRVRWSGIGRPTQWTISAETQSDYQDVFNGGEILAISGAGEYGVILMRDAIWRMTYVGAPLVFDFQEVERSQGVLAEKSIAVHGGKVFYLAEDGFYMFDGAQSQPIGFEKVNRWFLDDADANEFAKMSVAVDPANRYVAWSYVSATLGGTTPNRVLIYNWDLNRWSYIDQAAYVIARLLVPGLTLEDLNSISASIDALPASLDSRIWVGGNTLFAALSSTGAIQTFSGDNLQAEIQSANYQLGGGRSIVSGVHPITSGDGTVTVAVASKLKTTDADSFGANSTQDETGYCPMDSEGRYHRFKMLASGNYTHLQGLNVEYSETGAR